MLRWLLIIPLILSACSTKQPTARSVALNSKMRLDFAAIDVRTGDQVTLSKSLTKTTMVHFWATWCPQCLDELPSLKGLYEKQHAANFEIIAVALSSNEEKVKEISNKLALPFQVWSDRSGVSQRLFNAASLPFTVLLDKNGKILRFPHPETSEPVNFVSGAHNWNTPQLIDSLNEFIVNNKL